YAWVRAELEVTVAEQNLALGKEHLDRLHALAAADTASEADVARVDATVAASELVLVQAKNLALLERERLAIAMHDPAPHPYRIGEDFHAAPATERVRDVDALVRDAQQRRPEVAALAAQTRAYEKQAAVVRSQAFPRLDAVAQALMANPNPRYFPAEQTFHGSWQVGIQLTYSPKDTAVGMARAASVEHQAAAIDAQRRALLDAIRTEVTEAAVALDNAIAGVSTTARRLAAA